jgi:hypothetical protein
MSLPGLDMTFLAREMKCSTHSMLEAYFGRKSSNLLIIYCGRFAIEFILLKTLEGLSKAFLDFLLAFSASPTEPRVVLLDP